MALEFNTGSNVDRGLSNPEEGRTTSSLSTQVIIKVNGTAVGALQSLSVNQSRGLARVKEIGTDGVIEIVPNAATEFTLEAERIAFDALRLPEAFQRSFRFINAQRIPFDIEIFDLNVAKQDETDLAAQPTDAVVMRFVNCWFNSYNTPYNANDYLITERATIFAETGYVSAGVTPNQEVRTNETQNNQVEQAVNAGNGRRGSLDISGLLNSVFE